MTKLPTRLEDKMMTLEQIRSAWDEIAVGYDEFVTPTHISLAQKAFDLLGLQEGMRLLDVAAGSGALGLPAARLGAQVVAVDLSPAMVARLKQRARAEGLTNVQAYAMDAHALELEDDTFDVAVSQFGVMLLPDLPRALREMRRVTRPGGRVLLIAFGPPAQVEFISFFVGAMRAVVPGFSGLPLDPPPLPFQVADPQKLRQEMEQASLTDVHVQTVSEELAFHSAQELWNWVTHSNPIGAAWGAGLTPQKVHEVQKVLEDRLRERAGGSRTAILTNPVNFGIGTV
jgi:ubiquinone/menaquinone biosynthesis C-methylase UbiE